MLINREFSLLIEPANTNLRIFFSNAPTENYYLFNPIPVSFNSFSESIFYINHFSVTSY